MKKPKLSQQDAQALVQLARSAPLANMAEAESVVGIIQRFVNYVNAINAPKPVKEKKC